ncbi:MAG TPA: DEAD/DEAH box helicase [Alphaproteobacteria bacterium]|nr:DEAD/DEAH box helicase [Alphaproteobacteria bacterium]
MNFEDLGLKPEILRAVEDVGYTTPTPIQEQAIPYVLQGRDVLGIAQTGTGKTAGFTLPMIEILANGRARARMPRSLILEPTRELAAQVAENFELYGKYEKLNFALLIGGESFDEQIRKLDRGVDVLIATPGRMLDLFERGKVLLADVKILVIDEADRMLDMGFIPDIERIVGLLPSIRQTLFFSATMPPEIRRLADAFLSNPKQVAVAPASSTAEKVDQHVVPAGREDKREALRQLIRQENVRNALVFCNRKRDVSIVCKSLQKHGFDAGQLHGDMVQSARTETLEKFKAGEIQILVCSDVAARGIDISDLSHVFNFDVPIHAEDYVHRIGRTGRAGRSGRAFTLATSEDKKFLDAITRLIKREIPVLELPGISADMPAAPEAEGGRKTRGKRRGAKSDETRPSRPRKKEEVAEAHPPQRPERRQRDEDRDEAVVGLGDHTPAFLLRPVPKLPPRRATVND